jgi:hypothetical protein
MGKWVVIPWVGGSIYYGRGSKYHEYEGRYTMVRVMQGKNTLGYILHTGKKVRLQIRIDHKMFDIFTSRRFGGVILLNRTNHSEIT